MKLIKTFDVLVSLLLVAVGGGLVYASYWDPSIGDLIDEQFAINWIKCLIGVFLILIIILRMLASRKKKPKNVVEEYIDFKSGDAGMKISKTAVKGYIQGVGDQFPEIKTMSVELVGNKEREDILLNLQLKSGERVRELRKALRMRVRDCMCEDLGLDEKLGEINISIESVDGAPGKPRAAEKAIPPPQNSQPVPVEEVPAAQPVKDPVEAAAPAAEVVEEKPAPVEEPAPAPVAEEPPAPAAAPAEEEKPVVEEPPQEDPEPVETAEAAPDAEDEVPTEEVDAEEVLPVEEGVSEEESKEPETTADEPQEEDKPKTKLESESQYIFKPKQKQPAADVAKDQSASDEVELDAEDNPFLPK